jgi:hypothetical protein
MLAASVNASTSASAGEGGITSALALATVSCYYLQPCCILRLDTLTPAWHAAQSLLYLPECQGSRMGTDTGAPVRAVERPQPSNCPCGRARKSGDFRGGEIVFRFGIRRQRFNPSFLCGLRCRDTRASAPQHRACRPVAAQSPCPCAMDCLCLPHSPIPLPFPVARTSCRLTLRIS